MLRVTHTIFKFTKLDFGKSVSHFPLHKKKWRGNNVYKNVVNAFKTFGKSFKCDVSVTYLHISSSSVILLITTRLPFPCHVGLKMFTQQPQNFLFNLKVMRILDWRQYKTNWYFCFHWMDGNFVRIGCMQFNLYPFTFASPKYQ